MASRQKYESLTDALQVARDNTSAIQRLGELGWGHVVVAEVVNVDGSYEIQAVVVRPESEWQTSPRQHIARRFEFGSLSCPVCERVGVKQDELRIGNAIMQRVDGLDPAGCRGCHDVLTYNGIAPTDFGTIPPSPIPHP
jgi:hypothetical protein